MTRKIAHLTNKKFSVTMIEDKNPRGSGAATVENLVTTHPNGGQQEGGSNHGHR